MKTKPYTHQLEIYNKFRDSREFALFLEMGTGKTKIVLDYLLYNRNKFKQALVFCPKSVISSWEDEVPKHSDLEYQILIGPTSKKKQMLESGLRRNIQLFITNYEAVLSLYETFKGLFDVIILDESTYIKNPWAKRTKLIVKLGEAARYKIIMTGMAITNSPLDIWSQYRFLDNGESFGRSYLGFRNKYFYSDYNKWNWYPKNGSIEKINRTIYRKAVRKLKKECLDLPPKIYEKRIIEMPKRVRQIYDEMRLLLVAEINMNERLTVREAIVKTLRLQQITGGTIPTDTGKFYYNDYKIKVLNEIIQENPDNKIVIWCKFLEEIHMIERFFVSKNMESVSIYGDVKNRTEIIHKFQNDENTKYFIGQIKTAGMGITLTASNLVVYYSNSFSIEARSQSEDRCHRIGQKNNVLYIDILAKKSIDEYIVKVLQKKQRISDLTLKSIAENI